MTGAFIVVEGPEGAGKSTLVRALAARLEADGRPVVTVREPGGTPVAEAARKVALRFPHDIAPAAELFLFLAARADLVHRVIRPALEAGEVVVADRFNGRRGRYRTGLSARTMRFTGACSRRTAALGDPGSSISTRHKQSTPSWRRRGKRSWR